MTDKEKIERLCRHMDGVKDNCLLLAQRLMDKGEFNFAKQLVARGYLHDNSKFAGIEFDFLSEDPPNKEGLKLAISQHNRTNDHHPEFHDGGIHGMPAICVAEMVCDLKCRASERGTSLKDWIHNEAMKRYDFNVESPVYKTIMKYVDLLCDPPLKNPAEI